jgi:hypothetical protein
LPLAGAITKSELMALASVSPTVAGSKPKKLLDQMRDVLRLKPGRRKIWKVGKRSALRKARSVPKGIAITLAKEPRIPTAGCLKNDSGVTTDGDHGERVSG